MRLQIVPMKIHNAIFKYAAPVLTQQIQGNIIDPDEILCLSEKRGFRS